MIILEFDGTMEGFLSLVFESYERKIIPGGIVRPGIRQEVLFAEKIAVHTDEQKAARVWQSLEKKCSRPALNALQAVLLSELPDSEMVLYRFMRLAFASSRTIETDFGNPDVLEVSKIYRKVTREAHRMQMFVRFQKTRDEVFYSPVDPVFDVLPLVIPHFEDRFRDQQWLIYDTRRNYGFYSDMKTVSRVVLENSNVEAATGLPPLELLHVEEMLFQDLWRDYYKHITIGERRNLKLHRQLMPKRFWKYLPEKSAISARSSRDPGPWTR